MSLSYPSEPNPQIRPIFSPDWWPLVLLSEPFSLIKAICVSVGLEVSIGTGQCHQWDAFERKWIPCSVNYQSQMGVYPNWPRQLRLLFAVFKLLLYLFIATDLRIYHIQPQTKCRVYDSSVHETWLGPGRAYGEICHLDICQLSPCACAKESDFCLLKTYEPERSTLISCLMWHSVCN